MIEFVTFPDESISKSPLKLFLAGGITNCENWQSEILKKFVEDSEKFEYLHNVIVYNPRRQNFPMDNQEESEKQIIWEYNKLKESDIIAFWFSKGSINPISLYELGKWGNSTDKNTIIGIDIEYERKKDVEIQTKLARPDINITYKLRDFYYQILQEIKKIYK